ncbi:monovalent cation:proton antiporter-2 (CPA2) family protein [Algisphaera agarilytica]|uniref:CPA2 family monovalent cation:H+ antiporter-2/glutathione-regulated potassium-efflux system ancillary protein KefC n=1 Tax=Algisphaera agarilytica TaxID=1385975 RepID=A0A7X0H8B5_9BACT|nr:monovalent cation:proton antiporter-2 (CPA2) family protein [Algisphaera agarilytica]MBB6431119.1 CPA2 family monovalent cation:H+ antiporter-2/glutathione-regulated potassium-efflux system ancillary protein KefC [Algisphaera agarilytica]
MESMLLELFVFLAAAAIAVPIAKKLGLGSVLGYLVAGIAIGPFGLALIHDIEEVMHITEFGVVMMLFLVGLELKPALLWRMRLPILGIGGTQVVATSIAIAVIAAFFLPWQQALAAGLILSLSSTAIVLQTLQEKGQMDTGAGRSIFAVLLFQDLAVIPMLAGLPLLATLAIDHGGHHHEAALFDITALPGYARTLITLGAIVFVVIAGKFICGPVFRAIASTGVREVFVAAALALVIGTSVLMIVVGLSPALGAFLAGVMLADSEFRHELESDIEPFKGLLLGVFFITIGASLNFTLIGSSIGLILAIVAGLMVLKWLILAVTARVYKMGRQDRSLFAVALAQGGEFAFVLFQIAKSKGVMPTSTIDPLVSAVAISMFLTPIVFLLHDKLHRAEADEDSAQEPDSIEQQNHRVILAGFGRLGIDVGRFLLTAGVKPVILDHDVSNVRILRQYGFEVYYGDATRLDLLESAGAREADLLIVAIGDTDRAKRLIETTQKHYPNMKVITSAANRDAAYEMMDLDVANVFRETFGTALDLGQAALEQLGTNPYEARRLGLIFKKKDHEMMPELYELRCEKEAYLSFYQQRHENLKAVMELDNPEDQKAVATAWTAKNPEL